MTYDENAKLYYHICSLEEKERKMKNDIDNVQRLFAFYGFASCPIPRKKIASLLMRGKSHDQIYEIGCGIFCGAIPHVVEN